MALHVFKCSTALASFWGGSSVTNLHPGPDRCQYLIFLSDGLKSTGPLAGFPIRVKYRVAVSRAMTNSHLTVD